MSQEAQQDLAQLAQQTDQDLATLEVSHQGIEEFSDLATHLEQELPDSYVRAGISGSGDSGDYWILFTDEPSANILDRLGTLPVDVEVRWGAPSSSTELAEVSDALVSTLAKPEVFLWAGTRFDADSLSITLEYELRNGADRDLAADLLKAATIAGANASTDGLLPVPVVPVERHMGQPPVPEDTVQGGRQLRAVSDDSEQCTGGFTAVHNANRGILTARHCLNAMKYQHSTGVISTDPRKASLTQNGDWVDLQWHRTLTENSHNTNKDFRATGTNESDDRTPEFVANAPLNSTVCHWGQTTGYSCSTVVNVNECRTFDDNITRCGLDVSQNDISQGGDSGGPWFFGLSARGIHTGATQGQASYFTRIGRVSEHLDATVLSEPQG